MPTAITNHNLPKVNPSLKINHSQVADLKAKSLRQTNQVLTKLAKESKKKLLVFSPAFVADCLETLYEIRTEYLELFEQFGGESITLVESLNAEDKWVDAVCELVS